VVNRLPAWLRQHGFHQEIRASATCTLEAPPYSKEPDPETGILNADAIVKFAKEQASTAAGSNGANYFPVYTGWRLQHSDRIIGCFETER